MKKNTTAVLMVMVLCGVFVVNGYACGDCKKKGASSSISDKFFKKAGFIFERYGELQLSDDQKSKIKVLKKKAKKELIRKEAEIDIMGIDFKEAIYQDMIDIAAVNTLIDKKYEVKKEKTKFFVKSLAELKVLLTEEQKSKLKELYKVKKVCSKGKGSICPLEDKRSSKGSRK